jgi:alpha-D-xyloside xylohydrolase
VHLNAGQSVPVRLQWTADIGVNFVRLLWKPPVVGRTTSLWSKVGDGIDYTFVYGPELDKVVAGYRRLTGEAPMMPRWAYGFWQSRERYKTAQESLDVLNGYRSRKVPIDNIVQDWQYWKPTEWGSHAFDPSRFPDPDGWIKTIHDTYHAQLMISVWPKFHTGTANYSALNSAGDLYRLNVAERIKDFVGYRYTFYDVFKAEARQRYGSQINQALFAKGVDAWWVDASEPEIVELWFPSVAAQVAMSETHMHPTALGTGSRMLNAYSLVMDFRTDETARDIGDEFMFGPALLVSPVMTYNARTRSVYLPSAAGGWYDFWMGKAAAGGQTVQADAAFDSIPVYVRAGAIVPVGPEL